MTHVDQLNNSCQRVAFRTFSLRRRLKLLLASAVVGMLVAGPVAAQNEYPSKPLSIIVPSSPGSPSDTIARMLARAIESQAGSPVVVEDRPGANGIIGTRQVSRAEPDGHSILFTTMSPMVLNKYLFKSLPYDPYADFIPIALMFRSTMFLAVHPDQPFQSVQELIDFSKREPGKLNYGYGTAVPQLAGSLFEQLTGAQVTFVPYKSHNEMVLGLLRGDLDMTITDTATLAPHIKEKKVRVLATANHTRLPAYPDIPTFRELGIGYELLIWHGMFVPKGTPPAAIERLTELVKAAAADAELQAYLASSSIDNFLVTGKEAADNFRSDSERWGKITSDAGVEPK